MRDFSRLLLGWFYRNKRNLPWRTNRDPYRIWISEIMLQQTTVATVIPCFERWMQRFPNIATVARAREQTILRYWQGLGYYQRARNLHRTAKILMKEWGGHLPSDKEALAQLPGFGIYTIGAVGSIAFNLDLPVIDANIRRVGMRLLNIQSVASTSHDPAIFSFLKEVFPSHSAGDFNQALMELGALVCRPVNPDCETCPISEYCQAFRHNTQHNIPQKNHRIVHRQNKIIIVIRFGENYWIQQWPKGGLWSGLWGFPDLDSIETISCEEQGSDAVQDMATVPPDSIHRFPKISYSYTNYRIRADVLLCVINKFDNISSLNGRLVSLNLLSKYPLTSSAVKIVKILNSIVQ